MTCMQYAEIPETEFQTVELRSRERDDMHAISSD